MNILIVEDEPRAAKRLCRLIEKHQNDPNILAVCPSVSSAEKALRNSPRPDLIFLDVQLHDGECFQLFDQVEVTSPVVFCTAHAEYALRAFAVNAIDYLLKPLVERELENTLKRYSMMQRGEYSPAIWRTAHMAAREKPVSSHQYQRQFLIRAGERYLPVAVSDLILLEAHMKGVRLSVSDEQSWHLEEGLKEIEARLDPNTFIRVSRGAVVRLKAIESLERGLHGYLVKLSGYSAPVAVSRSNVTHLKARLNS